MFFNTLNPFSNHVIEQSEIESWISTAIEESSKIQKEEKNHR
jgi:hypothetical protein